MSRVHYESGLLLQWCSPRSLVIVRRTENDSHYRVTPAAMSQSRFLNPASALLPRNVAHDRAMSRRLDHGRKCRCQEGALASWRRSEAGGDSGAERQAIGWPALVGCRHLGLSLGSFSSIACNYAGLRGEGSTGVPLPPPLLRASDRKLGLSVPKSPHKLSHLPAIDRTGDLRSTAFCGWRRHFSPIVQKTEVRATYHRESFFGFESLSEEREKC